MTRTRQDTHVSLPPLATRALEQLICDPAVAGHLDAVYPRVPDAWAFTLPDLTGLTHFDSPARPLKICIATEDIDGPVRNGGIGTTYAALAKLLAQHGHAVTILYLKGRDVENKSLEHWVDHYHQAGIRFVPVPNAAARAELVTTARQWVQPMYNLYAWLRENPMDVVHVSEWRGSAYISLLAKRQGLAFQKTLFVIKASSPWLWNRTYGSRPIDRLDDLTRTYAERRSIELGDVVIGGSLHLLRWMASQGYAVPRDRSFVQPNVVSFEHLRDLITQRQLTPGTRMPIDELVFFGRLEARKGLMTFCQAIRRLIKLGQPLPPLITFLGKEGPRLDGRDQQSVRDFITQEARDWPCKISFQTDLQQHDALNYLLGGNRLAVMPSAIENSSLAVYEAAMCQIPFVASDTGGTAELIATADHATMLCDPHPIPLAERLADALNAGGRIATPSFDNTANLQTWVDFHAALGRGGIEHLNAIADAGATKPSPPPTAGTASAAASGTSVDVLIYSRGSASKLGQTIRTAINQTLRPRKVLIALDTLDEATASATARRALAQTDVTFEIVVAFDYEAGLAFNTLAARSTADFLMLLDEGTILQHEALEILSATALRRSADVLSFLFQIGDETTDWTGPTVVSLIGNLPESFYQSHAGLVPLFVRRSAFEGLAGFSTDYRVQAHDSEFLAKAIVAGLHCETVARALGTVPAGDTPAHAAAGYDTEAAHIRSIRPYLAAVPLALREVLLAAKGLQRTLDQAVVAQTAKRGQANAVTGPVLDAYASLLSLIDDTTPGIDPRAVANDQMAPSRATSVASAKTTPTDIAPLAAILALGLEDLPANLDDATQAEPATDRDEVVSDILRQAWLQDTTPAFVADDSSLEIGSPSPPRPDLDQLSLLEPDFEPAVSADLHDVLSDTAPIADLWQLSGRPTRLNWQTRGHVQTRFGGVAIDAMREGRVLDVHNGRVFGWVKSLAPDAKPVVVVARVAGRTVARAKASLTLRSSRSKLDQLEHCGFRMPILSRLSALSLFMSPTVVDLMTEDGAMIAAGVTVYPPRASLKHTPFKGFCEPLNADQLTGWVWNPDRPNDTVDVSIYIDNSFALRLVANRHRDDLQRAGVGDGAHGFAFQLPPALCDGLAHSINIQVGLTGVRLKGAPLTFQMQADHGQRHRQVS
jgi:glycosyltransferase involved in cell wall biosynthesis